MISVERFKFRRRRGIIFPPFLHLSIINSCNLQCQGCWVDVASPRTMVSTEELDRIICDAKRARECLLRYFGWRAVSSSWSV